MSSRFHYALQFAKNVFFFILSLVNHVRYWKYMVTFHSSIYSVFILCVCISLLFRRYFFLSIFSTYYYGFLILCVVQAAYWLVFFSLLQSAMLCFDFNQADFYIVYTEHLCHFIRFVSGRKKKQTKKNIRPNAFDERGKRYFVFLKSGIRFVASHNFVSRKAHNDD